MSGGRIILANPSSNGQGDYIVKATSYNVTGGTLQIGNSHTPNATKIYLNSSAPVPDLYLDNSSVGPAHPTARIYNSPLTVNGNLTLTTGTTLNGNNNTTNLSVLGNLANSGTLSPFSGTTLSIGRDFINSGTANLAGTNLVFNGGGVQNLTLNNPTTFNNLTVGAGTILAETVASDNATVGGVLINNGILRKSLQSNTIGLVSFGLTGVKFNITAIPGPSGWPFHIDRYDVSSPHAGPTQATGKYWLIDTNATVSNYIGDLTFPTYGVPSATAQVCKYVSSNTSWRCGRTSGTANSVTVANTFIKFTQEWTVGDNSPSAASLSVADYPSPVAVGTAHPFTVTLLDGFGNPPTNYGGRVNLTSSDSQVIFEPTASYVFQPSDGGVKTFTATFQTGGTQNIRATDAANADLTGAQNGIVVQTLPATHLSINGPPILTIGQSAVFTVTARDANEYQAGDYAGSLHFTSSDQAAGLPSDYTFGPGDAGAHAFNLTFNTLGSQSITATDTLSPTITGMANVQVNPITTTLVLSSSASLISLGQAITFTATVSPSAATGVVTFTNTTTNALLGTASLTNGTASLSSGALPAGQNVIQASYGGDSSYSGSSSNGVTVRVLDPNNCDPLLVTQATDDGVASSCGTFSYALMSASSGMTVAFALSGTNTIMLSGALTPTVQSGVTINGGDCTSQARIVINGTGASVVGPTDGLRLQGNDQLINLWVRGFKGPQVLVGPPMAGRNQFRCTRWSRN